MTKATVNTQHDYLTLKVVFNKDLRANLTVSRYSTKASGKGLSIDQMRALLNAFEECRKAADKYGDMMEILRKEAEKTSSPEGLAEVLKTCAVTLKAAKKVEPKAVPTPTVGILIEEAPPKGSTFNPSQEELQAAFDKVKNQKNWKARIDRTIPKSELNITLAAIAHFHGCMPYEVAHADPNKVIVRSKGYAC